LATIDMRLFMNAIWSIQEHSAWDLLPQIECPVLVIAAERDDFTPISCAQKITNSIPDASLVVLADGSHAALIEQPEIINYHVNKLLKRISLLND
jgi:pimeloyl-ACP methyl ester carboxylesterase